MTYEEVAIEGMQSFIKRTNDDGTESFIPLDEANSDYQAYLKSLEPIEEPVATAEDTTVADSPAKA